MACASLVIVHGGRRLIGVRRCVGASWLVGRSVCTVVAFVPECSLPGWTQCCRGWRALLQSPNPCWRVRDARSCRRRGGGAAAVRSGRAHSGAVAITVPAQSSDHTSSVSSCMARAVVRMHMRLPVASAVGVVAVGRSTSRHQLSCAETRRSGGATATCRCRRTNSLSGTTI